MTTRSPRRGAGSRAGVAGRCTDCCRRPHVDQRGVDLFCGSIRPCRQRFGGFGTRLRTFSKAYGLAGLRIGYGFGAPELARNLWTMQLPFGMAITSAVAVAASYDADTQLRQRIQLITAERNSLRRRLRAMGIYSTDAHANFVYLPSAGRPWHEVFDPARLQVRHFADGGVRITIGTRDSTRTVLTAVEKAMA
jgi:histidinol-phosphate aminotransferase